MLDNRSYVDLGVDQARVGVRRGHWVAGRRGWVAERPAEAARVRSGHNTPKRRPRRALMRVVVAALGGLRHARARRGRFVALWSRRLIALVAALALCAPAATAAGGGAGLAPPPPKPKPKPKPKRGRWLTNVTVTQYWPAPESWFVGALVSVPGLSSEHRVDWLYSATGVSMQGQGIGLDGRLYHLASVGDAGWVTAAGKPTSGANGFSAGAPFWRAGGYWVGRHGAVTFPLLAGGWYAGRGRRYKPLPGITFAPGPAKALGYYQSIAVDPRVIPLGSRVYVPAYRHDGHGGWFTAADTGGAITGRHLDVYRPPPAAPGEPGLTLTRQRVLVLPPRG
jgi:3D (Asp-Asp-Asp) domain-containing protein